MFEQETSPTQTPRRFTGFWLTELELNIAGKSRQGFLPAPRPQCTGSRRIPPPPLGVIDPWGSRRPMPWVHGTGVSLSPRPGDVVPSGGSVLPFT